MVLDLFAGPVVYRLLITGGDMSQMFAVEDQMDALMNGLRALEALGHVAHAGELGRRARARAR